MDYHKTDEKGDQRLLHREGHVVDAYEQSFLDKVESID